MCKLTWSCWPSFYQRKYKYKFFFFFFFNDASPFMYRTAAPTKLSALPWVADRCIQQHLQKWICIYPIRFSGILSHFVAIVGVNSGHSSSRLHVPSQIDRANHDKSHWTCIVLASRPYSKSKLTITHLTASFITLLNCGMKGSIDIYLYIYIHTYTLCHVFFLCHANSGTTC